MDSRPRGVVPATAAMARDLGRRLSADHLRELADTCGLPAGQALALSLAGSAEAYALLAPDGERAEFLMGVEAASPITGSALVWMLGSDAVRRRPAAVLRTARWGLGRAFLAAGALRLEQYIPDWYRTGLRFARRLGFVVIPPPVLGLGGTVLRRVVLHPSP